MTPEEREILNGFFQRLREAPAGPQDEEAAAAIRQELARDPGIAYRLAQTALVYEQGLTAAQERIRELQAQLEARPPARTGSFLPAVPRTPSGGHAPLAPAVPPAPPAGAAGRGAFGNAVGGSPGGGFLASAMSTALGVAGGMALFSGLQSLFSGGSAHAAGTDSLAGSGDAATSPWGADGAAADGSAADSPWGGQVEPAAMEDGGWSEPDYGDGTGDFGDFDDSGFDF